MKLRCYRGASGGPSNMIAKPEDGFPNRQRHKIAGGHAISRETRKIADSSESKRRISVVAIRLDVTKLPRNVRDEKRQLVTQVALEIPTRTSEYRRQRTASRP